VRFENRHRAIGLGHHIGSFICSRCYFSPLWDILDGVFTPLFTVAKRDSVFMAKI
jgi:hypothetical protein